MPIDLFAESEKYKWCVWVFAVAFSSFLGNFFFSPEPKTNYKEIFGIRRDCFLVGTFWYLP